MVVANLLMKSATMNLSGVSPTSPKHDMMSVLDDEGAGAGAGIGVGAGAVGGSQRAGRWRRLQHVTGGGSDDDWRRAGRGEQHAAAY